ncbi:MAG: hypothetical protein ACOX7H_01040 [Bacillota bacterium]|jgi:DNA anti-recombination protein RmuC
MSIPDRENLYRLLNLSQEKLALLKSFAQSLKELCEDLNKDEESLIAAHIQKQQSFIQSIDCIDKDFKAITASCDEDIRVLISANTANTADMSQELQSIREILAEQIKYLGFIRELNRDTLTKARSLASSYKDKIISINREKHTNYYPHSPNQVGMLLNYKENG